MRTWLNFVGLLLVGTALFCSSEAMRLREEPYPGLANVNRLRTSAMSASGPEGRVAGGTAPATGTWPWIVSIQNIYSYHICCGVIVDNRHVATAASCVSGLRARNLICVTGTNDWWNLTAPYYQVEKIHTHCNFDKPLYHNDIALLQLSEDIVFDDLTQNITLADIDELQEGDVLTLAGWGATEAQGTYERYLHQASGTYLPVDKCRDKLQNQDDVDLGHVCVQMNVGQGVCHGDTGGPLIDQQNRLVGIGNWGVPCARGYPDVYARAAFYNDWIRTTINGCTIS